MVKKLIIAEKPSAAKAIAEFFKCKKYDKFSYRDERSGLVVVNLLGHILELSPADGYCERYSKWDIEDLPIIPRKFKLIPKKGSEALISYIGKLLQRCSEVCVATDPDRQGVLLGYEVLDYLNYTGKVTRAEPRNLDNIGLKRCFENERAFCSKYLNIYNAARAQRDSDWLYGINITRALTVVNQEKVDSPIYSGRVQTAILELINLNEEKLKNFIPKSYYTLELILKDQDLVLNFKPSEDELKILSPVSISFDSDKSLAYIKNIKAKIDSSEFVKIKNKNIKLKKICPPTGYSLTKLQKDAYKHLSITPNETTKIAQKLYEDYKITSYPRTDSVSFPLSQYGDREIIVNNIFKSLNLNNLDKCNLNMGIKRDIWNDDDGSSHHAIVPTLNYINDRIKLNRNEYEIYKLICINYLMQFMDDYLYESVIIESQIDKFSFTASGKTIKNKGWTILSNSKIEEILIPHVNVGDLCKLNKIRVKKLLTKKPASLNLASLLDLMENAWRLIDPKNKELIKLIKSEKCGIGTEATRSGHIDKLMKRGLITTKGKVSLTKLSRCTHKIAPIKLKNPMTTSNWEYELKKVECGQLNYNQFMKSTIDELIGITGDIKNGMYTLSGTTFKKSSCPSCSGIIELNNYWSCKNCLKQFYNDNGNIGYEKITLPCENCGSKNLNRYKNKKNQSFFYKCEKCNIVIPSYEEKPLFVKEKYSCLECRSKLAITVSKSRVLYWRCTNVKCSFTCSDDNKKPVTHTRG
ncbi:DNA topoisomerase [Photobacterium leiognathi]|uniref:DNA topoisomerase n=1 Tax=Photobacterium leiognathi TaxID=553611 RepID=UPI0029827D90|nr:DNA topoisomerase [Photobacterium leiognathi]